MCSSRFLLIDWNYTGSITGASCRLSANINQILLSKQCNGWVQLSISSPTSTTGGGGFFFQLFFLGVFFQGGGAPLHLTVNGKSLPTVTNSDINTDHCSAGSNSSSYFIRSRQEPPLLGRLLQRQGVSGFNNSRSGLFLFNHFYHWHFRRETVTFIITRLQLDVWFQPKIIRC